MVALTKTLDNDNDTMGGGFPLSVGDHPFIIVGEEVKTAQSGNSYLQFHCVTNGGPQSGAEFSITLNLWNANTMAVEIAERELNTIRVACGMGPINDSSQLINQQAVAIVKQQTRGKNAGQIHIANYESVSPGQTKANPQSAKPRPQPPKTPPQKNPPQPPQSEPPQHAGGAPWRT